MKKGMEISWIEFTENQIPSLCNFWLFCCNEKNHTHTQTQMAKKWTETKSSWMVYIVWPIIGNCCQAIMKRFTENRNVTKKFFTLFVCLFCLIALFCFCFYLCVVFFLLLYICFDFCLLVDFVLHSVPERYIHSS